MKIQSVELYGYELTYAHGEYVMSKGRAAQSQSSTLVRILTDDGLEGWGETSTLGGTYLPAFTSGTRAALSDIAPLLVGLDPRNISQAHRVMDDLLLGQANAKSGIDIALWDILGKAAGLPVATLLGGITQDSFPLYEAVPLSSPEAMVEFVTERTKAGLSRWQVKVGNDPHDDAARTRAVAEATGPDHVIVADSNGGWNVQAGITAVRLMADLDVYIEQPCRDTADCAIVQRMSALPLMLDESIVNSAELYRGKYEAGAGGLNIKLGRLGGITGATRMRNLAQDLNLIFCIEDVWGGDVTTAAVAHVAASARPDALLHASFFNDWTKEHVATRAPRSRNGRGAVSDAPGLGVEVDAGSLGKPFFSTM